MGSDGPRHKLRHGGGALSYLCCVPVVRSVRMSSQSAKANSSRTTFFGPNRRQLHPTNPVALFTDMGPLYTLIAPHPTSGAVKWPQRLEWCPCHHLWHLAATPEARSNVLLYALPVILGKDSGDVVSGAVYPDGLEHILLSASQCCCSFWCQKEAELLIGRPCLENGSVSI